jgi:hypothetical protein
MRKLHIPQMLKKEDGSKIEFFFQTAEFLKMFN